MSPDAAVAYLVDYEGRPDDVDARIGRPDHAQVTSRDLFSPDINIDDARQRWLFRMIHTRRPLQEKMALFWHNHFATAYSKLIADSGAMQAAKMMALQARRAARAAGTDRAVPPVRARQLPRPAGAGGAGPAMLVWLDGQSNTAARPQENFGREVMELFTVGVGHYTEPDVYAAARVFTGWNLRESEGYRRRTTRTPTRSSSTTPTSTTPAPRRSRSRSTPTAAARFPSAARRRACRTASI